MGISEDIEKEQIVISKRFRRWCNELVILTDSTEYVPFPVTIPEDTVLEKLCNFIPSGGEDQNSTIQGTNNDQKIKLNICTFKYFYFQPNGLWVPRGLRDHASDR